MFLSVCTAAAECLVSELESVFFASLPVILVLVGFLVAISVLLVWFYMFTGRR